MNRLSGMLVTKAKATCAFIGTLLFIACQNQSQFKQPVMPGDSAPGSIIIDIVSPKTGGDRYWRYRLVPSVGEVAQFEAGREIAARRPDPSFLNGIDCFRGAEITSPNHQFIARCFGEEPGKAAQFTITALSTGSVIFRWTPAEWRGIDGFAWSPSSRSFAMANYSEHYGRGVVDWFWAKIGHPVPYHTFYVEVIDAEHQVSAEYLIRREVLTGSARILNWSN